MKLKQFLTDHREKLQLIYGVFLIILIPSLLAYNTIGIIGRYNDSMDKSLQRQALGAGRSAYVLLQSDLGNDAKIQDAIDKLMKRNTEFENVTVLVPEGDDFKVAASSAREDIGKVSDFYYYNIAWKQPDNDGLATDSLKLSSSGIKDDQLAKGGSSRFWMVAMPMQDQSGNRRAILSIKVSSEIIDQLTENNKDISIYILLASIIITVFFLLVTVKIWDYVLLYNRIKEVDQLKDEFISIASHELRTPLTAIKGYTSLIVEGTFGPIKDEKMKQSLDRIMTSVERLEELVEDLLNVSRLEQGRLEVDKTDFALEPVVEEIVSQLSITASQKGLALEYKKPEMPLPLVNADSDRLKQVLVNVVGNSIKYTETGSVTVETELKDNAMRVKVTDTGIGISPEAQKRLFQKFYRVQSEKTAAIRGTGLGLWITKQIIELMGGQIYLESIEGKGTQVTVVLPLAAKSGE